MREFDSASQARSAVYGQASAGPLCGLEMAGALGNDHRFGFDWNAQQRYLGAVLMYATSSRWSVRVEPAFGLSNVSDRFMLRTGLKDMFGPSSTKAME